MVLPLRLDHYLATTNIDPTSCRGFEDEAFQALIGLCHYTQGTAGQRNAWYQAVWNAHMNSAGTLKASANNKSFFYSAVLNRKNSAFGYSLAVPPKGTIDAGQYPWALDDRTFFTLDGQVKQNMGPAGGKEITWGDVAKAATGFKDEHGLSTPVAAFGWLMIQNLVKKYAPKAVAALIGPEATLGVGAAAFVAIEFRNYAVRTNNAAAKVRFAIDERRRLFDIRHPITPAEVPA